MKIRILALAALLMLSSCITGEATSSAKTETAKSTASTKTSSANEVKLLYFHTNQRCITCNAIEKYAKEVVAEMNNEGVNMDIINISKRENKMIAQVYEVSWSSLFLTKGEQRLNLTELGFRYAKNNPQEFKVLLKKEIEKYL